MILGLVAILLAAIVLFMLRILVSYSNYFRLDTDALKPVQLLVLECLGIVVLVSSNLGEVAAGLLLII